VFTVARPGWIALGTSLLLHGLVFLGLTLCSPAGATRASVTAFAIDTRVDRGRSMHLTLWEAPGPAAAGATAPPTVAPAQAALAANPPPTIPPPPSVPSLRPAPTSPAAKPADLQAAPAVQPAKFVVHSTGSSSSDYQALTGAAGSSSPGGRGGMGMMGTGAGRGSAGASGILRVARPVESVVFVVDGSSSMGNLGAGGTFERARRELIASIAALPAAIRFQVIVYNRSAIPLRINGHSGLVAASDDNKQAACELIRALEPEGATNHMLALQQAITLQPEVILFVTDGDGLRADQVRALTVLNQGKASIDTFELSSRPRRERSALQILAEQNRGDFRRASLDDR
jgi:hypothetical protein